MLNELTSERMKELTSERIMKNVMKTILRNTKLVMILAFLPALLSAEQAQAVDYKSTYKGVRYEQPYQQVEYKGASTATAPMAGFQSTSAYSGQLSGETQSMLNSDGSVNGDAYMGASLPGRSIRKSGTGSGSNPGTPDDDEEEEGEQQPLGDGLMALMLCACAYLIVRATRKEEKIG